MGARARHAGLALDRPDDEESRRDRGRASRARHHLTRARAAQCPQPGNLRRWSRRRPPNRPDGQPAAVPTAAQLSAAGKSPPVQAEYRNHGDEVSRQRELSDPLVATSGGAPSSADRSQSVPSGRVVSPIIVDCREAARRARAGAAWRSRCVTCLGSATLRASTRPRPRPDRFCAAILPRRAGGFITSRAGLARCWTSGRPGAGSLPPTSASGQLTAADPAPAERSPIVCEGCLLLEDAAKAGPFGDHAASTRWRVSAPWSG
jgi:hypothetical protein